VFSGPPDGRGKEPVRGSEIAGGERVRQQPRLAVRPPAASKLEALLESTIAMQKMFLKHMETDDSQSEGGVKTSRSFERAASRDDGGKASREEKTIVTGAEKRRVVEPPRRRSSAVNKWREDGQEDQDEYDRQFLKNLKEVTDKFVSAGKETRQISEEAANNVNAEASRLDRTEHEEEEEEVEGQDELDEDKITSATASISVVIAKKQQGRRGSDVSRSLQIVDEEGERVEAR